MTDYYKTALEILHRLLKEPGNEHWANWIAEDIRLWTEQGSTKHHAGAFGGMGSLNDQSVGGWDTIGIWRNTLFHITKGFSWSLATRKITTPPVDEDFYRRNANTLSGWRCRRCGYTETSTVSLEIYLSHFFLPKLFAAYIQQDRLIDILDLEHILVSNPVVGRRSAVEKIITRTIPITDNGWLLACPKCGSKDICVYRWQIQETELVASEDNIVMKFSGNNTRGLTLPQGKRKWWQRLFKY